MFPSIGARMRWIFGSPESAVQDFIKIQYLTCRISLLINSCYANDSFVLCQVAEVGTNQRGNKKAKKCNYASALLHARRSGKLCRTTVNANYVRQLRQRTEWKHFSTRRLAPIHALVASGWTWISLHWSRVEILETPRQDGSSQRASQLVEWWKKRVYLQLVDSTLYWTQDLTICLFIFWRFYPCL